MATMLMTLDRYYQKAKLVIKLAAMYSFSGLEWRCSHKGLGWLMKKCFELHMVHLQKELEVWRPHSLRVGV